MTRINWPRIAALAIILSLIAFIGLTWLWYFSQNGYYGMTLAPARSAGVGGWGIVNLGWASLIVLGLMHLSFWVLLIAGIAWLVHIIGDQPRG